MTTASLRSSTTRAQVPRRRWSPSRVIVGVLLCVVVGAAIAGVMNRTGAKTPILVLARRVPESAVITRADLTTVAVSGAFTALPESERDAVVGRRAAFTLEAGTILQPGELSPPDAPDPGQASVGVSVAAGLSPAGLKTGDTVQVVEVPDQSAEPSPGDAGLGTGAGDDSGSTVLVDAALIVSLDEDPTHSGDLIATLRVPVQATGSLLAASHWQRIGLAKVARS